MTDDVLTDAGTVLVLASRVEDVGAEACVDLLANAPALDRLLVVAVGSRPAAWHRRVEARPSLSNAAVEYVDVRTVVRSSSADADADAPDPVATVSSPADLGTLGTVITDRLAAAEDRGERVGLCLHSISDMLEFVDREFLFRFVHAIGARARQSDAVAAYHLDNDAPDDELTALFAQVCDAVVSVEAGELTVTSGGHAVADGPDEE